MNEQQFLDQEKTAYAKVEAPCPYFGVCGGCALQDLAYPDQLALKQARLRRVFASLDDVPPVELVGLDDPWRYRNKAELTFNSEDGRLTLGYHAAKSFWRIIDLDECLLLPEPAVRVLRDVRTRAARTGLPAYHARTHQGCFRYLLVRCSHATGQMLLCLMTTPAGTREVMEALADGLMAAHPAIASVYWGRTDKLADIAVPDELDLVRGARYLEDRLGPFALQLHPLSFIQPNSVQADRMYTYLIEALRLSGEEVAWDLYCGIGLVGFYLSSRVRKVYSIDVEPRHLELAALNASRNGLSNLDFRAGEVETVLRDRRFWLQEAKPHVVVVDPPRAGLQPHAVASLFAARPTQIAYISCNPQSLARDLGALLTGFPRYRLTQLRAFDMFPQTNHVETVAVLTRA